MNKEVYWVFGVMALLIVIFLVSYSIFNSLKSFNYGGLEFTEEKFGEIPLFHYIYIGKVRTITGNAISYENKKVDLFLRNDPRENNVPIDADINFPAGKTVYVGIDDQGIPQCKYSVIGLATLSSFLSQNGFGVRAGTLSESAANANNIDYISCEKYPLNPVILIQEGAFTKVTKTKQNCYLIEVDNCETLPAVEKFVVKALIDAKARAIENGQYDEQVKLG